MADYKAYDAGLPCKNPHCKSEGHPHPNCQCYPGLAEGGEASQCSGPHKPDCQYFQNGGQAGDDSGFNPDAYLQNNTAPAEPPMDVAPEKPAPSAGPSGAPPPAEAPQEVTAFDPESYVQQKANAKYSTLGQMLTGGSEAFWRGMIPGYPWMEKNMQDMDFMSPDQIKDTLNNTSYEAQEGRAATNPKIAALGQGAGVLTSLATGVGGPGMMSRGVEGGLSALANAGNEGYDMVNIAQQVAKSRSIGQTAVQGMLTNGLIQGQDEVSKYLLGEGDPQDPVGAALAHIGFAAAAGGTFGILGGAINAPIAKGVNNVGNALEKNDVAGKIDAFLMGFGKIAENPDATYDMEWLQRAYKNTAHPENYDWVEKGQNAYTNIMTEGIKTGTKEASGLIGSAGGLPGYVLAKMVAEPVSTLLQKTAPFLGKNVLSPLTFKILSSDSTAGLLDVLSHAEDINNGYNALTSAVGDAFTTGTTTGVSAYGSKKDREKTKAYMEKGGYDQNVQQQLYMNAAAPPAGAQAGIPPAPRYAEGGEVEPIADPPPMTDEVIPSSPQEANGIADIYPEQNVLMSAANGRVSNYLNTLRPQKYTPRLAFDDEPDMTEQEKSYDKAVDLANHPLGIMQEIKNGTVEADHIKHVNAMYPETTQLLQKEVTKKIMDLQLNGGQKPPYKIRQGLSMLMGTPLSGEMTPQNIQAAQAVFAPKQGAAAQQGAAAAPAKNKKGTSSLTKSDESFMTGSQALQKRQQKMD